MLKGWEVKSLREGRVDVKDSYVRLIKDEAWLIGLKIDPPSSLKNENLDPTRSKKLLLNKNKLKVIIIKNIFFILFTCYYYLSLYFNC